MKATLLPRTPELLETLRHAVQGEDVEVTQARVRAAGEPLAPLLRGFEGDLLVVQGECRAAEDLVAIERLTAERPSVLVLLLCSHHDSEGLVAAMRAGVHEVLHSPPEPDEIAAALRRAARRRKVARPGVRARVIAFIACKGGSGATLLATNVAYLLATEREKKVALIDLDLEYGDATSFLTDQRGKGSVADITRHVERLDAKLLTSSMIAVTPRLMVLPAPDDPEAALSVTGAQVERVLDMAGEVFDIVILDLGRMFDGIAVKALDRADVICPVMEDLIPCIRDAKRLMRSFRALGYPDDKIQLVVNRYDRRSRIPLAELEAAVGAKVRHTVPNSFEEVAEAINLGLPLLKVAPRNPVIASLRELAVKLVGPAPSRGWLERLVGEAH